MHDGSVIRLHKLESGHDCRDRTAAMAALERHRAAGEIATGLIYVNENASELHESLGTTARPSNELDEAVLCAPARRRSKRSTRRCAKGRCAQRRPWL